MHNLVVSLSIAVMSSDGRPLLKASVAVPGSEEAAQLIQGQGVRERVHSLVASTDTPAAAAGGGTAALLHNTSLLDYAGFAMTAKPSVNLLVLLQVCALSISYIL